MQFNRFSFSTNFTQMGPKAYWALLQPLEAQLTVNAENRALTVSNVPNHHLNESN